MPLERAELIAPLGLELIEEGLNGDQRLRLEAEDPDAGILGDALVLDDPGAEQDPQMPTERRRGHAGRLRQLSGPVRSAAQQLDHPSSRGIGKGLEHIH